VENQTVEIARRDTRAKKTIPLEGVLDETRKLLDEIQQQIYQKALKFRNENTFRVDTFDEFKELLETRGGFMLAHWDGTAETEMKIKEETKATIRVIPVDSPGEKGTCIYSGKPSKRRVLFARAY